MALPIYVLLLICLETSKAPTERGRPPIDSVMLCWMLLERYIAINRFSRGATRQTNITCSNRAFLDVMTRPSTYVFFVSYFCLLIIAVALGTFLPIILNDLCDQGQSTNTVSDTEPVPSVFDDQIQRLHRSHLPGGNRVLRNMGLAFVLQSRANVAVPHPCIRSDPIFCNMDPYGKQTQVY